MRPIVFALVAVCAASALGQELPSVLVQPRKVVIHNHVISAQAHAEQLAATGSFGHCSRRGGGYEGIGIGATPDDACRRCCFWGQRRVREIGTAWSPVRRAWIAVVRYE